MGMPLLGVSQKSGAPPDSVLAHLLDRNGPTVRRKSLRIARGSRYSVCSRSEATLDDDVMYDEITVNFTPAFQLLGRWNWGKHSNHPIVFHVKGEWPVPRVADT